MLKCSLDDSRVYYTTELGFLYVTGFALQLILTGEALRVINYEGVIKSKAFGDEKLKNTWCYSIITCCQEVPNNVFVVDEKAGGGDDGNEGKSDAAQN